MKPTTHRGPGSVAQLETILDGLGSTRAFIVTGKQSFTACGAELAVSRALKSRESFRFCDFSQNPRLDDIERGVASFRSSRFDVIVAVGGGSALDTAKLINLCAAQDHPVRSYLVGDRPFTCPGCPLVAVPTTAGSGAECTHFATVYVDGEKHSVQHPSMLPPFVILDPELTHSLPRLVTAATSMDALSQGIESYWSVNANDESRRYAEHAIRLASRHILSAVNTPTVLDRERMMEAANLAGKAINISKTTAPHALSYAFTTHFGVPHGHAVGLTLGLILAANARVTNNDVLHPGGPEFVRERIRQTCALLGHSNVDATSKYLDELMERIGLTTNLRALGVARRDLTLLVASVNEQRLKNNPRKLTPAMLGALLESRF